MNVKKVQKRKRIAAVTTAITTAAVMASTAAPAFAKPVQGVSASGILTAEAENASAMPTTIPMAEKQVAERTAAAQAAHAAKDVAKGELDTAKEASDKAAADKKSR